MRRNACVLLIILKRPSQSLSFRYESPLPSSSWRAQRKMCGHLFSYGIKCILLTPSQSGGRQALAVTSTMSVSHRLLQYIIFARRNICVCASVLLALLCFGYAIQTISPAPMYLHPTLGLPSALQNPIRISLSSHIFADFDVFCTSHLRDFARLLPRRDRRTR